MPVISLEAGEDLFKKDFADSALDPDEDPDKYGVFWLDPESTSATSSYSVHSALYVYHDLDGEATEFFRLKLLTLPEGMNGKTPGKYWQQPNSSSKFYLPKTLPWREIASDPSRDIYITEGERKALCGAAHGLNMLAVSGVANWKSTKRYNQHTIEDLDQFNWDGRTVWLCFDADMVTNAQVTKQLNDLSHELTTRGVRYIKLVEIPANTPLGPKIGLDDFIHEYGFSAYQGLIDKAQSVKGTEALWEINERFAFVHSMAAVYDSQLQSWVAERQFNLRMSPRKITRIKVRGDGDDTSTSLIQEDAATQWWQWRFRREYETHDYFPGQPATVDNTLNTWTGWGTKPEVGNVQPFLDLFEHLTFGLKKEEVEWLWQWMAWPLQDPLNGKMFSAIMLYSKTEGSGKSFLGEILSDIYGLNAISISSPSELFAAHNDYMDNKQLIVADEVLVGSRSEVDRVKNFITAKYVNINPKNIKSYRKKAMANWILSSNHNGALKLSKEDRRWFVIHVTEERLDPDLIMRLRKWRSDNGIAHLHNHLLTYVDCSEFAPWKNPPVTKAHDDMVVAAHSSVEEWVHQLKNDPDSVLRKDQIPILCDLFTEQDWMAAEIVPTYLRSHPTTVRNTLRDLGFEQRTRVTSSTHWPGGQKNLWCLRHHLKWANLSNADWAEHYANWLKMTKQYMGDKKSKFKS